MKEKIKEFKEAQKRLTLHIKAFRYKPGYKPSDSKEFADYRWDPSHYFRHRHLAYCLARNTPYSAIEAPRHDNLPNWRLVNKYFLELTGQELEEPSHEEAVRVSQG